MATRRPGRTSFLLRRSSAAGNGSGGFAQLDLDGQVSGNGGPHHRLQRRPVDGAAVGDVDRDANGAVVTQSTAPTFTRSDYLGACDATAALDTVPTVSPDGAAVYSLTGGHYQYNWSTKSVTKAGEYRIYANLADGTHQSVFTRVSSSPGGSPGYRSR